MAASSTRGGGYFVGVFYGLIVSAALYLVLCYLFPVQTEPTSMESAAIEPAESVTIDSVPVETEPSVDVASDNTAAASAPVVMATVGTSAEAPVAGEQPVAPTISIPEMAQPDSGTTNSITIGGAGDSGPSVPVVSTPIASTEAASEPDVATEPAGVPDIGDGTRETAVPADADIIVPTTTVEVASPVTVAAPSELVESVSGPAIEVFASAFTGDTSKPMLAIVLEDTLEISLQPLVDAGIPITFAVPAGVESRENAQAIRESGFEVVALIPAGVSRTEGLAENIERFMHNVPVAVALMDSNSPTMMLNRDAMQVIIETSGASGLGLVTYAQNGELVARSQAEEAGVLFGSALQISDDFEDEELIIQALNQAAFVAGTNDRAIVYAKTKPAVINALLRWLQSARAGQVEIVPVSVVLQLPSN